MSHEFESVRKNLESLKNKFENFNVNTNNKTDFEKIKQDFINTLEQIAKLLKNNLISFKEFNYLLYLISDINDNILKFERYYYNQQQKQQPPKPKNTPKP